MPNEGTVFVVDDHEPTIAGLRELLERANFTVQATSRGEEAVELAAQQLPDVVLLDVVMPRMSGMDICVQLKQCHATRMIPVVLMTGTYERDLRLRGLARGADDIFTKPIDLEELRTRLRALVRMKRLTDELESSEALFLALARFIEARDPTTEGHCERLANYAVALGNSVGLERAELRALYRGGFLHDIGKIAIPDRILLKKGRLTPREYALMKSHPRVGDELCATVRSFDMVRPIVRWHHERLDGRGYPDGLAGEGIPLLARIVTIVDVFDALTNDRPYRKALTPSRALALMRREARAGAYSLELVERFAALSVNDGNPPSGPPLLAGAKRGD